jgi:hypothetical protein
MGRTITYFVFFFLLLGIARYLNDSAKLNAKQSQATSFISTDSVDTCDIDEIYPSIKLTKSEDFIVDHTDVLFFKLHLAQVYNSTTPSLCDTFREIPQRPPLS